MSTASAPETCEGVACISYTFLDGISITYGIKFNLRFHVQIAYGNGIHVFLSLFAELAEFENYREVHNNRVKSGPLAFRIAVALELLRTSGGSRVPTLLPAMQGADAPRKKRYLAGRLDSSAKFW